MLATSGVRDPVPLRRSSTIVLLAFVACAATASDLARVTTSPAFFNPTIGQASKIGIRVRKAGTLRVSIVDRDGLTIRSYPSESVKPGTVVKVWNGRDDRGVVVPDEAYFPRVEFRGSRGLNVYDPTAAPPPTELATPSVTYARATGTMSYILARPARVHIQAGQARRSPELGAVEGPVLKTVVDRRPRVAGRVVEQWNGLDESGQIYVPDLPDFALAVVATPLPENAMMAVGNRDQTFVEYAVAQRPLSSSPPEPSKARNAHHRGLNALEDVSPTLRLEPKNVVEQTRGEWVVGRHRRLRFTARIEGETRRHFLAQPNEIYVFLDAKLVQRIRRPESPQDLRVSRDALPPGRHRLIVNWVSDLGPVGIAVVVLNVEPESKGKGASP